MEARKKVTLSYILEKKANGEKLSRTALYDYPMAVLAEEAGIPWQLKRLISGSNGAAAVQRTRTGVRTGVISVPVRYLHAPSSIASIRDMEGALALTRALIFDLAKEV